MQEHTNIIYYYSYFEISRKEPASSEDYNPSVSMGDKENMSENDDMKQDIPTPRGAGRKTLKAKHRKAMQKAREDYWRTIRELRRKSND
jgi:hypothetical protein